MPRLDELRKIAAEREQTIGRDADAALRLLVKEGIYDKQGNLTPEYGGEPKRRKL